MHDCLRRVNTNPGSAFFKGVGIAETYATLGEVDRTLRTLESAYRQRDGGLILLNADPRFDRFKSDPRFQQLLQRIGLPH